MAEQLRAGVRFKAVPGSCTLVVVVVVVAVDDGGIGELLLLLVERRWYTKYCYCK